MSDPTAAATVPGTCLVSVVVPTYQHAGFIEQCIAGILMQETTFPVEILIGEDESTDGTRAICQRLAAEHPERIRLFLRSRKEVMHILGQPTGRANLLHLLGAAKGKYIVLCEGDDYWTDPVKLQQQVDLLEDDPHCMGSYHATVMVDEHGASMGRLMREALPDAMTIEEVIAPFAPFHTSSFLFRAAPSVQHFASLPHKQIASGDLALFTVVAAQGKLCKAEGAMSAYRQHAGSITTTDAHRGTRFHHNRILLWLVMGRWLRYRHTVRCQAVMAEHWAQLVRNCTPRARLRFLAEQARAVPRWFLRHPAVLLRRLRDALHR